MATVRVTNTYPGSVHEAEICWYATDHWPEWVDELARVISVEGDWPLPGSSVNWQSGPAGRGNVRERVVAYEALGGQTVEVQDDSIEGRQRVSFTPADDGVEIELSLDYAIKRRSVLTPLIDALFVRRLMAGSLRKTLTQFGLRLAESRHASVG